MQLYVVRHAHAGSREAWTGDDLDRPLSARGRAQADAIADHFAEQPIDRVLSSPAVRCIQTVQPLAARRGVDVETDRTLFEGSWVTDVIELLTSLEATTVVCTHGDVVPDLLRGLANRGADLRDQLQWPKGSTWVLERDGSAFTEGRFVPAPDGIRSAS